MKINFKDKKNVLVIFLVFALLIGSLMARKIVSKANNYNNQVAMDTVSITGIDTGGNQLNVYDGLNYYTDSNSFITETGYVPGQDANAKNRIVRSFDTLTYHFNFNIKGKNAVNDFEERKVNIKVTLSDEEAKYVTFDENERAGKESSHTFTFDGIDTYGDFNKDIVLYVLGAPNGFKIRPKFEIQESTNTDAAFVVTLGNINADTTYYDYNSDGNKYSTSSNTVGFTNYMPTIVSSTKATLTAMIRGTATSEGQKATYKDQVGRYMTAVVGLYLTGNINEYVTGMQGVAMPADNSITLNLMISSSGGTLEYEDSWIRPYDNANIGAVEPITAAYPYSINTVDLSQRTRYPGTVKLVKKDGNNYELKISDFYVTYKSATKTANNEEIGNDRNFIGTYALTFFSGRTEADGKNDIMVGCGTTPSHYKDTNNNALSVTTSEGRPYYIVNKYYEVVDYSLKGEFYDESGSNRLFFDDNKTGLKGSGSVSKGTTVKYRTTFDYKKTASDQGLKEIIKFDTNAYRVVPISDKQDIKISVVGEEGTKLSPDDFEVSYISGAFSSNNYTANTSLNSRINPEDKETISTQCQSVSNNLSTYSADQIQNLYGGPCISAKEGTEKVYSKIAAAKITNDDKNEIEDPITKIIVQTKEGVKLPDSVKVIVDVNVKVRNVSDLTQTYQATAVATSSDYDTKLSYYSPRVLDSEESITNPNNYSKTLISENNQNSLDTNSLWGDCLRIVNFTARSTISVKNKNSDGTTKINYNVIDNETINYNIKTVITDNNELVGADDTWYINMLVVEVRMPDNLIYIPDKKLGNPEITDNGTYLYYHLPYTKPNQKIPDINFKAMLNPKLQGSGIEIPVSCFVHAININGEKDTSYFRHIWNSFNIYGTGIQNVIVNQKIGPNGSVLEKNQEFSYVLNGYNNTGADVSDYDIVDILPFSGDKNGSRFSGKYKVKVTLPANLNNAKVTCSKQEYSKLTNEVFNNNNVFEDCNITEDYVDATAIRISDIEIPANEYIGDIIVSIKPEGNNYSDKYINSFVGGSRTYSEVKSNKIEARVISRNISGRAFVDMDEDGIEEDGDQYLSDIPLTLYKLDSDNKMTKVSSTTTDKNGYYKFKDLDVGRYKIQGNYNDSLYDLALRYATEDYEHDSDAYKIKDGEIEIAYTRTIDDNDAVKNSVQDLKVTREVESIEDMNIGFINRKNFGFDMSKYITKIDLSYNNSINTLNYNNESKVSISVKNSLKATAKVYYGITLTNNSTKAGYAKLIQEDIPNGMIFDPADPYNSQWFATNGVAHSVTYANDIIYPGESRYLKIALYMPRQEQATTFINTATMLEIEPYEPEKLADDKNADYNLYSLGEAISYAGINWHVIGVTPGEGDEEFITLLADSGTISDLSTNSCPGPSYKWGDSEIRNYIHTHWARNNSLNLPILLDQLVCNDASGTPNMSYGGTLLSEGKCTSNDYVNTKIRLLTETEYTSLKESLSDISWLKGNKNFWLTNSAWGKLQYNSHGVITHSVSNQAKIVNSSNGNIELSSIQEEMEVRPVITISNKNIIPE